MENRKYIDMLMHTLIRLYQVITNAILGSTLFLTMATEATKKKQQNMLFRDQFRAP